MKIIGKRNWTRIIEEYLAEGRTVSGGCPQSTRLYSPLPAPGAAGAVALNTQGGINPVLPATQTVLNTTETVIVNPSIPTAPLQVQVPAGSVLEQEPFEIVASGFLNHGTSSTVTIKLYSGTSLTVGSDSLLGTSGAISAFAGKANWLLRCTDVIYDSQSGKLNGRIEFLVNGSFVAQANFSTTVTGINNNPALGTAVLSLLLSVTFGTGGTQIISVHDFGINH